MTKREFLNLVIILLLAGLLFACDFTTSGGNGNNGNSGGNGNNTVGGGLQLEPTIELVAQDVGETALSLKWTTVPGVEQYQVMLAGGGNKNEFYVEYTGNGTTHIIKELVPGEEYYIHVMEKIPSGSTIKNISNKLTVTMAPPSLPAFGAINSKVTAHDITLTWDAIAGAGYYRVYRVRHDNWRFYYSSVNEPTFTNSGLGETGREYGYKVVAFSADGSRSSGFSEVISLTTAPVTLTLPAITMEQRSYELEWSWPMLGADEAMLYEEADDREMTGITGPIEILGGQTGYKVEALLPGQEKFYRFRLVNKVTGAASPYSKLFVATTSQPELTAVPTNLNLLSLSPNSYNPGYYDVEISWDAVAGADEYHIFTDEYARGEFMMQGVVLEPNYKGLLNSAYNAGVNVKVRAIKYSTKEGSGFSEPLLVYFK